MAGSTPRRPTKSHPEGRLLATRSEITRAARAEGVVGPAAASGLSAVLRTLLAAAPFNDRVIRVWGNALTPQVISMTLATARLGYMWNLADLLDENRECDGHLHSVLAKREMRVSGAEWELQPPAGSGDLGKEVAAFCTERLGDIEAQDDLGRAFPDMLEDLQGAVYQGRAVQEVVWRSEGRWTLPDELRFVHPRRLAYVVDWRLHLWDASGTALGMWGPQAAEGGGDSPFGQFPGIALEKFPRGKFVGHRPRIRGVYPTREGLGPLLLWWSCFKRFATRDWLAFAEWVGRGLRLGKYNSGKDPKRPNPASDEDRQVLEQILLALSSAMVGVVPDTTEVTVESAPTNNDVHEKLSLLCNTEISKIVLGGTLTTEVGTTGGNRSLGEVHAEGELMIARADARKIWSTLRRDLLRPMVEYNFGPNAPVPTGLSHVDPKGDLDALARRGWQYVQAGGELGVVSFRDRLGLPAPTAGEALMVPRGGAPKGGGAGTPGESGGARGDAGSEEG